MPQGEAVIDGTRPATNKLTRSPHFGGCNIELTSMLKSGSTWTEIVVLMLSQRACDNDPTCTFSEVHARGRSAHNRTVGFHFDTATERPGVEFGQCNRSVQFNSAHKHNFWGLSFYREGLSDRRSVFALLHNKCVWQNLDLKSEECFQAMLEAAPDKGRMQMMRDHWLTVACLRDPRAVAVSECHWMGHSTGAGQEGGLGSSKRPACRETTTKFQTLVFATAFLYNYWTNILPNRSHLVVYEKMVTDPRTEYRRIADFIGVGSLVSDEEIAVIADETTATALAKKEVDGTLLGKTKVSNFNPSKQVSVRAHEVGLWTMMCRFVVESAVCCRSHRTPACVRGAAQRRFSTLAVVVVPMFQPTRTSARS